MKPLYDFVQSTLKDPLLNASKLLNYLSDAAPEKKGEEFCDNDLIQYVAKRLVKATTVQNPTIKQNAAYSLRLLMEQHSSKIDFDKLLSYIVEVTDSKNAIKKNETPHFLIGRLLVLNSLVPYLNGFQKRAWRMISSSVNSELSEQVLETICRILKAHPSKKVLAELENSQFTHSPKLDIMKKSVLSELKHQKLETTLDKFDEVANLSMGNYPRENFLVKSFTKSVKWSAQQWGKCWNHLIEKYSDQTVYGYRGICFIMEVLKAKAEEHLTSETLDCILHKPLLDLWMNQLVVLNKKCRQIANSIIIDFGTDEDSAFRLLEYLHENKVIIGNIQKNHPLQNIYKLVNPSRFLKYLLGRIDKQYNEDELCQSYAFVRLTPQKISEKLVTNIMRRVLTQQKENQANAEKYLAMVWSLVGWKLKQLKVLGKHDSLSKAVLLLQTYKKLTEGSVKEGEALKQVAEYITSLAQVQKEEESPKRDAFLYFASAAILWSGLTGQEIETCSQLLQLGPDLMAYINLTEATQAPRKKRKTEDPKKPVHVLVDIFIAYLTRSPKFLRQAIEECFKTLVGDVDESDLKSIIAVLTRPDNEYLQNNVADD